MKTMKRCCGLLWEDLHFGFREGPFKLGSVIGDAPSRACAFLPVLAGSRNCCYTIIDDTVQHHYNMSGKYSGLPDIVSRNAHSLCRSLTAQDSAPDIYETTEEPQLAQNRVGTRGVDSDLTPKEDDNGEETKRIPTGTNEDIDWGDLPSRKKVVKVFTEPGKPISPGRANAQPTAPPIHPLRAR